jgi:hypothetical protein
MFPCYVTLFFSVTHNQAVSQSFAAGTFIYVATVEVFSQELYGTPAQKRFKFLLACIGLLAMALLKLLEPPED